MAGSLIASGPAAIVLAASMASWHSELHGVLLVGTLVHFCNFTTLNSWMKSCAATLALICYVVYNCLRPLAPSATIFEPTPIPGNISDLLRNVTAYNDSLVTPIYEMDSQKSVDNLTMLLSTVMVLALVWFLNREFEIGYRLSVHGNMQVSMPYYVM